MGCRGCQKAFARNNKRGDAIMIKGRDAGYFIFFVILGGGAGLMLDYFLPYSIDYFSELITFLSIMFGFQMSAFSLLFNSRSLASLYNLKDDVYRNRLMQLSMYFKFTFTIEFFIIVCLFVFEYFGLSKMSIPLSIFCAVGYCFCLIGRVLFEFFETPRNT